MGSSGRGGGGGGGWGGRGVPIAGQGPPDGPDQLRNQLAALQSMRQGDWGPNPLPGGTTSPQNTIGLDNPGANFSGVGGSSGGSGGGGFPFNLPGWGRTAVAPQQGPMRPDMVAQPTIGRGAGMIAQPTIGR